MPRLYHPDTGHEHDAPDDDAYLAVMAESGWKPAPEPEDTPAGVVPDPVKYEPVKAEKPKATTKKSTAN
jgi:hypothetical protein